MVGDVVLTASKATGHRSGADRFESLRCNSPKSFTRMVADRLRVWDVSLTDEGVTVVTLIGNADVTLAVAGAGSVHLGLVPSAEVD